MTIGFRVRNQNKILQIDESYSNMTLYSSNTYTMNQSDQSIFGYYVDISTASLVNPVLATSGNECYIKKIGSSLFRVYSGQSLYNYLTVRVWIFAKPANISGGGFPGLVIRNPITGEVVFNSNYRYMRVIEVFNVSLGVRTNATQPNPSASRNYPGKTIAVIQQLRCHGRQTAQVGATGGQGIYAFFSGVMTATGPNVTITNRAVASAIGANVGGSTTSQPSGSYLIIDVTGY